MDSAYELLPIKFDLDAAKKLRKDSKECDLCEAPFTSIVGANPRKHCKKCAAAICKVCCCNKRVLSRSDKKEYRVCDRCDTEMDNFKLKQNHKEVLEAQVERIEALNNEIEDLDNRKIDQQTQFEKDKKEISSRLQAQYERRDQLNSSIKAVTAEIGRMNVTRNYLHQNICELDKVIVDFEYE